MQLRAFSATIPNLDGVVSPTVFFDSIKVKYISLRNQGRYTTLPSASLYIHQINKAGKSFLGLVGCIDLREYLGGKIIPHEKTITSLEDKQIRLLNKTRAQLKPVMLAHRKTSGLQPLLHEVVELNSHFLEVNFEELGEMHRYWQGPEGELTERLLHLYRNEVPVAYVADGHHRLAANARLFQQTGQNEWVPAALYEEDQLRIFAFNRIVKIPKELSPIGFIARLSQFAEITPLPKEQKPLKPGELTVFMQGEWFRLTWKTSIANPQVHSRQLDVDRLNSLVLEGVLGISDIRSSKQVRYIEGVTPLSQLMQQVRWNKNMVLFCLPPIDLETFFYISDQRQTLPPKSTWFEPRIRSGVLVRELN